MATVTLIGAEDELARAVAAGLRAAGAEIRLLDGPPPGRSVESLAGTDTVVNAAPPPPAGRRGPGRGITTTRQILDAADRAGVVRLVHLSSAVVYGAWPDNPVPLLEDAPLRPNPGVAFAAEEAEAERLVAEWRDAAPGRTAAVLRPPVVLGERNSWVWRALSGMEGVRVRGATAPVQFLHAADLASAVVLAARRGLDGAFNVAPDGWLVPEMARQLAGAGVQPALPEALARRVVAVAWSLHLSDRPPATLAYSTHPWVVANDSIRAAGWVPDQTNEEALVAVRAGSRWRELSPKRRQEVALGAAALGVAGVVAGAFTWYRRRR